MKIDEKMSPRERLLLFSTLELLRKEIRPKFSDWKDADDWLFAQLDFSKDELRQVYDGRNVAYYDGSAVDFEAAKKKRFDNMFIFDDEIHVTDDFTGVSGYLWATGGLVDKLKMEVGADKIDYEENINFYADYNVLDKKLEVTATYFEPVPHANQQVLILALNEEEKEALLERFEAYSKSHGRELSLFDFVNEARGDYDMELLGSVDEIVTSALNGIRGFGVDQGSGFFEINEFDVDGEKFAAVIEVFKQKEPDSEPYYGVYWFVEYYDGDTLFSDWEYTKSLDENELRKVVSDLANRDFTDDVKKELYRENDNMLLAREEYEHYKDTWRKAHGVTDEMVAEMKEQYRQVFFEGEFEGSFEEYEQEFGYYGGNIYVCFNEFMDNEFEEIKGEHLASVNKIHDSVEITGSVEATLLSADEYEKYKENIPNANTRWWLRSAGVYKSWVACVSRSVSDETLDKEGMHVNILLGVRPALVFDSESNLAVTDKVKYGTRDYTVLDVNYNGTGKIFALCDECVNNRCFDEKSNSWEKSDLKEWVEQKGWLIWEKDERGDVNLSALEDKMAEAESMKQPEGDGAQQHTSVKNYEL